MTLTRNEERLQRKIDQLELKVDELEFRISEMLAEGLVPPIDSLTVTQFRVVQAIARRSPMTVTYEALFAYVGDRSDQLKCIGLRQLA